MSNTTKNFKKGQIVYRVERSRDGDYTVEAREVRMWGRKTGNIAGDRYYLARTAHEITQGGVLEDVFATREEAEARRVERIDAEIASCVRRIAETRAHAGTDSERSWDGETIAEAEARIKVLQEVR